MTQFNNELYAGFLPEAGDARFEGKRGFYPAMTAEEYRALPLPMKCATWDARVQYVIFDSYFRDYELSGKVEVHAENAFKALFRHSETDTQLYSVCAVRLFDGTRVAAKWVQDSVSGAFRIVTTSGNVLGTQGGFRGHIPENCKKRDDGTWGLFPLDRTADRKQIIRVAFDAGKELFTMSDRRTAFDAITKDKPTLAGFLRSLPCIEAPWDAAFQKRYCSSCTAENCDACANEQFRNNPEWWLSLPAAEVEQ